VIEASQMRLKINANDSYTWEKMKEKAQLFSKNLSDLSTDQLKNLCDDVDKSFVVIWKIFLQSKLQQNEKKFVRAAQIYQSDV